MKSGTVSLDLGAPSRCWKLLRPRGEDDADLIPGSASEIPAFMDERSSSRREVDGPGTE